MSDELLQSVRETARRLAETRRRRTRAHELEQETAEWEARSPLERVAEAARRLAVTRRRLQAADAHLRETEGWDENAGTEDLAGLYAELWAGQHPRDINPAELATAHAELAHGEHSVNWDEAAGWHVAAPSSEAALEALLEAVHRAPKGGVTIQGEKYRGGMFIPSDVYKNASAAERQAIDEPALAAADRRRARGPVDEAKLRQQLQAHGKHELTDDELRSARRSLNALKNHHGNLTLHRLEELADEFQAAHDRTPRGDRKRRTALSRRLKAIEHQIDMAKEGPKPAHNTLYKLIRAGGGIDVESLKGRYDVKTEFIESGLLGILAGGKSKGKRRRKPPGLDQWAETLQAEGHISVPEDRNPEDYLLELLHQKARSQLDDVQSELESEERSYHQELENARQAGFDQSTIEEVVRLGEEAGLADAEKGDAWEGPPELAHAQDSGEVDPWDEPARQEGRSRPRKKTRSQA